MKIAILVYRPLKTRMKKNCSFIADGNIGINVIRQALVNSGYDVKFCSPATACKYNIVLVSFTSSYDMISYYQQVSLRPDWIKRKFIVIGGGFGMQNPIAIREFLDYAVFGRAENQIINIIRYAMDNDGQMPKNCMIPSEPSNITLEQTGLIETMISNKIWKEEFTGCKSKCKFCHYTYARKYQGNQRDYVQKLLAPKNPEILWKNIAKIRKKIGRFGTAIDGNTEMIRSIYGKNISNKEITEGINQAGQYEGTTVVRVYNILNMPGEKNGDIKELYDAMLKSKPPNRVIIIITDTPFRPSPITPMHRYEAALTPAASDLSDKTVISTDNLLVKHSLFNENPWSHLITLIIERASPDTDQLFKAICLASGFRKGAWRQKLKIARDNFDLTQYTKRYAANEKIPTWFLKSYSDHEKAATVLDKKRENYNLL